MPILDPDPGSWIWLPRAETCGPGLGKKQVPEPPAPETGRHRAFLAPSSPTPGLAWEREACEAARRLGAHRFWRGWETPLAWRHVSPLRVPRRRGTHYPWVLRPPHSVQRGALGMGVQRALEVAEGGSWLLERGGGHTEGEVERRLGWSGERPENLE